MMSIYPKDSHFDFSDTKTLMELLKRHGFYTNKSLGQHFLISQKALSTIVNGTHTDDKKDILEIGPGVGVVTRALLEDGYNVTAIELDRRAIKILNETVGDFETAQVIEGDILKINIAEILKKNETWVIVGNLPYYITTPVIIAILEHYEKIDKAIFMVQKEVAERLCAKPDNKTYGSITVFCDIYSTVTTIAKVPKGAFMPPPNVESAVICLEMRKKPIIDKEDIDIFSRVLRGSFQQRRKQICNSLMSAFDFSREVAEIVLKNAGIAPSKRAENLNTKDFCRLTQTVKEYLLIKDHV